MVDKTILMIEDETDVMLSNQEYLEGKGMRVLTAESLAEADRVLEAERPDIILLDVKLPDGSGLDYVRRLRERCDTPVVFLTCYNEKEEIIRGLQGGGCDYIAKPHDLDVLYARLTAQLRRQGPAAPLPERLTAGALTLNLDTHRALVAGRDAMLKPMEYSLLLYLVKNRGRAHSGETLYNAVWGRSTNSDVRTVRVHIHEIRRKLREAGGEAAGAIETLPGEGYRFLPGQ